MKSWKFYLLFLITLACSPDEIGPQGQLEEPSLFQGPRVFIINEGNFGRGNASISAYHPQEQEVQQNIYQSANALPLGDVAQDMKAFNKQYFISLNASSKIVVVDSSSWEAKGEISGVATPRYLAFAASKGFATDLFQKKLWVFDPITQEVINFIPLPSAGKNLEVIGASLYVACGQNLVKLDPWSEEIESSISMSGRIASLSTLQGRLFALCHSNPAMIYEVYPDKEPEVVFQFQAEASPAFLCASESKGTLLINSDEDILKIDPSNNFSGSVLFSYSGQNIYGMNVDPKSGDIYLADALDYNQASRILRYAATGELLDSFDAGVISNGFFFSR